MILAENCHLEPASNMVSESVQLSHFKNVEAENSLEKRKDQVLHQGSKRQENKGPPGASSCLDSENSGKVTEISARDTEGDLNVNVQNKVLPVSNVQDLLFFLLMLQMLYINRAMLHCRKKTGMVKI